MDLMGSKIRVTVFHTSDHHHTKKNAIYIEVSPIMLSEAYTQVTGGMQPYNHLPGNLVLPVKTREWLRFSVNVCDI